MNANAIASLLTPEQLKLFARALERKALFYSHETGLYAACFEDNGWWVYRLEPGSKEYFIHRSLTSCSCEGFKNRQECKHLTMVKHGSNTVPWKPSDKRKRKRVRT